MQLNPNHRGAARTTKEKILMEDRHRKSLALMFLLFLLILYKQQVYDRYFYAPNRQGSSSGSIERQPLQTMAETGQLHTQSASQPGSAPTMPAQIGTDSSRVGQFSPVGSEQAARGLSEISVPTAEQITASGSFQVENARYSGLEISFLGGRLISAQLRDYRQEVPTTSPPLDLVKHDAGISYPLGVDIGGISDTWVNYELVSAPPPGRVDLATGKHFTISPDGSGVFELRGVLPDGREIRKVFVFQGSSYLFDLRIEVNSTAANSSSSIAPRVELVWAQRIPADSEAFQNPFHSSGYSVFAENKTHRFEFKKIPTTTRIATPNASWISMADRYFASVLVSAEAPATVSHGRNGDVFEQRLEGGISGLHAKVFVGPKSLEVLEASGYGLEHNIDFGWTAVIARPMTSLLHLFFRLFGNYGLAIIALTILVRAALFPINQAAFNQMKRMQDLAPEVKRIRETVKDKQQQQLQMMELYKKNQVNPLGGCLPMLIQLPIFIGLYSSLVLAVDLRHAPFVFWIRDLSAPERLMIDIGALSVPVPVMVLLFVASMYVQQMLTPKQGLDPVQQRILMIMPVVFGFMFYGFPAGLTLYWLTNNIISIGQQQALYGKQSIHPAIVTALTALAVFGFSYLLVAISS